MQDLMRFEFNGQYYWVDINEWNYRLKWQREQEEIALRIFIGKEESKRLDYKYNGS